MVPTHYIHLAALPLTSNGKLNKKALPEPEIKSVAASAKPKNQVQKELVQIWADVLNIEEDKIGVNTNFFDIGGNSLMLVKMADKINRRFNAGITVAQVFTYPVIEMLAGFLTQENETVEPALETGFEEMNEAINLLNRI
jgi:acyl carrier protein